MAPGLSTKEDSDKLVRDLMVKNKDLQKRATAAENLSTGAAREIAAANDAAAQAAAEAKAATARLSDLQRSHDQQAKELAASVQLATQLGEKYAALKDEKKAADKEAKRLRKDLSASSEQSAQLQADLDKAAAARSEEQRAWRNEKIVLTQVRVHQLVGLVGLLLVSIGSRITVGISRQDCCT